jgi:glycosyltransferase involved in cell wall biosynthesis
MPKLSVITVCMNPGSGLLSTIQSVKSQIFRDFEYIIIDGQSNDGTKELVDGFPEIISGFLSEADNGIYDAMNKGISYSKGEFLIFLNAGDYFSTEYSLQIINNLVCQNNPDIYFGKIIWVDPENNQVITSEHDYLRFSHQLMSGNFPHPATIYTKDAFYKYGSFNKQFRVFADYEWNLRALIKYNASFTYHNAIITTFKLEVSPQIWKQQSSVILNCQR